MPITIHIKAMVHDHHSCDRCTVITESYSVPPDQQSRCILLGTISLLSTLILFDPFGTNPLQLCRNGLSFNWVVNANKQHQKRRHGIGPTVSKKSQKPKNHGFDLMCHWIHEIIKVPCLEDATMHCTRMENSRST